MIIISHKNQSYFVVMFFAVTTFIELLWGNRVDSYKTKWERRINV